MSDNEELLLLWKLFISGNSKAFHDLYRETVQFLFRYGLQFTQERELVKDCIHDVFFKLYKNRNKLGKVSNVKVYFCIVLKNILIDELRKREHLHYVDDVSDDFVHSSSKSVEEQFVAKEKRLLDNKRIKALLDALTPRQREVLFLRYVEDLEIKDIAEVMKMKYQSVENLLQRALIKARKDYVEIIIFILGCFFYK